MLKYVWFNCPRRVLALEEPQRAKTRGGIYSSPARNMIYKYILVIPMVIPEKNLDLFNCLKDECPVDALRACVFIYSPYILKNNVEFRRK